MCGFRHAIKQDIPSPVSSSRKAAAVASSTGTAKDNDTKLDTLLSVVQDARLRKVLQMIESHPSRRIHDLALECHLSGSRLQHLFKQRTGLVLWQLLTERRMQQAADLLVNTEMSIKEIAITTGYGHASSFTRAFERRFRQAPSCYRQMPGPEEMPTEGEVAS